VFKILWRRIPNEAQRFPCPFGSFVVSISEALSVVPYCVECRLVCVEHEKGSVGCIVIINSTFALFEDDVFVGLDHVEIVAVLAVVSDG
jgi:hypothetical protein